MLTLVSRYPTYPKYEAIERQVHPISTCHLFITKNRFVVDPVVADNFWAAVLFEFVVFLPGAVEFVVQLLLPLLFSFCTLAGCRAPAGKRFSAVSADEPVPAPPPLPLVLPATLR